MKKHKVKVPIFNDEFTILLIKHEDELEREFPYFAFDNLIKCESGAFDCGDDFYVVFRDEGYMINPGIIVHESKHLVNYIFNRICHSLDLDNDEVECYLLQWVFDQIHSFLKSHFDG